MSDDTVVKDYATLSGASLLKKTLGHQNRQSSTVIGATSDFDPVLTRSLTWNSKGECPNFSAAHILRRANQRTHFMMRPDLQDEMDAELANLDAIESFVAPHGPELVNLYFRIVHPSFPILHKRVFLEKYGRSYRELTPTGLGAVYILGLGWWSYSPALSSLPKPDAKELEARVLKMLFEVHRRPKISDLQGGLVLMQSPNVSSWALAGHLVAMAQNLGINLDCSDWQVPDWERGVRKRVAWALFIQDKWGALVYGRGSLIKSEDWDVRPLESSDFPETSKDDDDEEGSAEIEKGKQTYLQMVSLSQIVAEILHQFFTLKALRRPKDAQDVLSRARPLQQKLREWYMALPPALSVDETVPRKLSSVGYLHLAYYIADITLHRAIIRSCFDAALVRRHGREAGESFASALDFVKRLKAEHHQSFWYFPSGLGLAIIGVFSGILCAATEDQAERDRYLSQLAEYRWILRINATSAEFMRYAVGVLDARSQLLEQQFGPDAQRRRESSGSSPGDPQPDDETGITSPSVDEFLSSLRANDDTWGQPSTFGEHYYDLELGDLGGYTTQPTASSYGDGASIDEANGAFRTL